MISAPFQVTDPTLRTHLDSKIRIHCHPISLDVPADPAAINGLMIIVLLPLTDSSVSNGIQIDSLILIEFILFFLL